MRGSLKNAHLAAYSATTRASKLTDCRRMHGIAALATSKKKVLESLWESNNLDSLWCKLRLKCMLRR